MIFRGAIITAKNRPTGRSSALRQHRTIPALRLKHRSGSCGTASALPKWLDNVGLRYPHRASGAKAPRTLRPLPLFRFAVSATGGAHLCSIQYYLCFWLSICRTSLAVSALRIMRYCLKKLYMDITRSEKQGNPGNPTGKSASLIPALPLRRQFWRWLQPAGGNNRLWCHRALGGCGPQSGRSNTGHRYIQTRPNRTRCIFPW